MHVDVHAHILVADILADDHRSPPWRPKRIAHESGGYLVQNHQFKNGPAFKEIVDPAKIVAAFQKADVDLAILSTPPYAFFYDLPVEEGEWACQVQNDGLARAVSAHPNHLAGLGTLPLQDVSCAIKELERVMGPLGLSGIEIASSIHGQDFSDPCFLPFWEAVEALDALVLVHPAYFDQIGGERLSAYYLRNLLGNPMETAVFAAHLIFSGVLEKYPNLKIVLAHAGGVAPYLRGRLDHGYQVRTEPKKIIPRLPGEYLNQFYFDTITHNVPTLQFLVDTVGADHVLLGSDYPFDMGYERPVDFINQVPGLDAAQKELILGGNALRLLNRVPA